MLQETGKVTLHTACWLHEGASKQGLHSWPACLTVSCTFCGLLALKRCHMQGNRFMEVGGVSVVQLVRILRTKLNLALNQLRPARRDIRSILAADPNSPQVLQRLLMWTCDWLLLPDSCSCVAFNYLIQLTAVMPLRSKVSSLCPALRGPAHQYLPSSLHPFLPRPSLHLFLHALTLSIILSSFPAFFLSFLCGHGVSRDERGTQPECNRPPGLPL